MIVHSQTKTDEEIQTCIEQRRSFYVIAGAGSGKTASLVKALEYLRNRFGSILRRDSRKVVCITYTNRAVDVISSRLGWDDLYSVSTLHHFMWMLIKQFPADIRFALVDRVIPARIAKQREDDNGGNSVTALNARARIAELERAIHALPEVTSFNYDDSTYSNYEEGLLGHDDIISTAVSMIEMNPRLRALIGQMYPYILVDEAQDTFEDVVGALNKICMTDGLPIVGYFGDPMQQIYDKRAGAFVGPPGSLEIKKVENYRNSLEVINFLNAFRQDLQQVPSGNNKEIRGSVLLRLVRAENPGAPRGRYTPEQSDRASGKLQDAIGAWRWNVNDPESKQLFLVRQMIARKLGFHRLHTLFTGVYASSKAQEGYEKGDHFLLSPFVDYIYALVKAYRSEDQKSVIRLLCKVSPAFNPAGVNSNRSLRDMRLLVVEVMEGLVDYWDSRCLGDILRYCQDRMSLTYSPRLREHLGREPRDEAYIEATHLADKGDWLADEYFKMRSNEIGQYCEFINENTAYSTQHGVKGEEYENVLVVMDDVEAAWNQYSFTKTLTPNTSGAPTDRQLRLGQKLAYVCFSRAKINLRVLLFTPNPEAARNELIGNGLLKEHQIEIAD